VTFIRSVPGSRPRRTGIKVTFAKPVVIPNKKELNDIKERIKTTVIRHHSFFFLKLPSLGAQRHAAPF
jgi:hypothetical protein